MGIQTWPNCASASISLGKIRLVLRTIKYTWQICAHASISLGKIRLVLRAIKYTWPNCAPASCSLGKIGLVLRAIKYTWPNCAPASCSLGKIGLVLRARPVVNSSWGKLMEQFKPGTSLTLSLRNLEYSTSENFWRECWLYFKWPSSDT